MFKRIGRRKFVAMAVAGCLAFSMAFTGCTKEAETGTTAAANTESGAVTASAEGTTASAATESTTAAAASTESGTETAATESSTTASTESSTETASTGITMDNIRSYVVGIDEPVELKDGTKKPIINFDNAATTPSLTPVSEKVEEELKMYGSVGRGFSQKSDHSTDFVYQTRQKVISFVGADKEENEYTCVFVNNTTDGLNKLASALVKDKSDVILTTRIEHHSNDLSWRERGTVVYAEVDEQGRVKYEDIEKLLKENKVKIVSVTAASNVTGYVTDVHRVAKLAHQYGAMLVVDGAQIVAHRKFEMKGATPEEDVDFLVFSAHKMYSPYGGGAIVGKNELMLNTMPDVYGGGTVNIVADSRQEYKNPPESWEAGSPNYTSIVGLNKAIDILQEVGFDKIEEHEKVLNRRLIDGLKKFDNIIIYGDTENIDDRVGVVTFDFSDLNSYYLAVALKEYGGVATRRGSFCAHPYVWRLKGIPDDKVAEFENCEAAFTPGMIRISFGIYNTEEEVDQFLEVLPKAIEEANKELERLEKEDLLLKPIHPEY